VKKNLVLLGMMAVGKTTLGKIVAKKEGLEFIDVDSVIEKKNLMTISEVFKKKGEEFFRTQEEKETLKILNKKNCIISLGGGAFLNKKIRESVLKNSISIWLDVDLKTISKRVKWSKKRPLVEKRNVQKKIEKLYFEREGIYQLANHKIACDKHQKDQIVEKIIDIYAKY